MRRIRSMKQQLLYPLRESTRYGVSKRVDRLNNVDTNLYIYSLGSFKKLRTICEQFAEFIKLNYPATRLFKEITKDQLQNFIDHKGKTLHDVTNFRWEFNKILKIACSTYKVTIDYEELKYPKNRKANDLLPTMNDEDYDLLIKALSKSRSGVKYIPQVTNSIGTRMEEAISIKPDEIDLDNRIVYLNNCKNGKKRKVYIQDDYLEFWRSLKKECVEGNWPNISRGIRPQSAQGTLRSYLKKLGLNEKYTVQVNHAIRKRYAQRRFYEEYEKSKSIARSWGIVQQEIGHGKGFRNELFRTYLGCSRNEMIERLEQ